MRLACILICSFVFLLSAKLDAARMAKDTSDLQGVKQKIKLLEADIRISKKEVETLEEQTGVLKNELRTFETDFQTKFAKILAPILSWPSFPPMRKGLSWVEQEHLNIVLLNVREKIAREPLELISNRDLLVRRVESKREETEEVVKNLERKEGLLRLQLEELEFLQKSNSRAKISKSLR